MRSRCLALALVFFLGVTAEQAIGDGDGLVWALEGERNTVYLVGSIHLLRKSDYPLPASIQFAYDDAEALLMELDMDDLDQMAMASALIGASRAPEGQSLSTVLGDRFEAAQALAAKVDIDLSRFDAVQPWFAALTITQMAMMAEGFDPMAGVEMHITRLATGDTKPIEGLETLEEQIDALSGMDLDDQADFLMLTLAEMDEISSGVDTLVTAWREGDVVTMVDDLIEPMNANPDVVEAMLTQRNRNWIDTIEAQLGREDDVMVLVGAAHLVGENSVNDLLAQRGHKLRRIRSAE